MSPTDFPTVGTRTSLDSELKSFPSKNIDLHLGGSEDFHHERAHHTKVFGFHSPLSSQQAPINNVEFTAIRDPHGTIPIRVFYPKSGEEKRKAADAAAFVYFHGGGYTVGTVDEFENGLRIVAEESSVQVYVVEYRLAPEWRFPTQLDEYEAVITWLQGEGREGEGCEQGLSDGGR